MNRAFIEWGRRKIGLPEKPVINSGCIDATKERHCIIVFADEPYSDNQIREALRKLEDQLNIYLLE